MKPEDTDELSIEITEDETWGGPEYRVPQNWTAGAVAGIRYALQLCDRRGSNLLVMIRGTYTDTNPTLVGVAAAFAISEALGFSPPVSVRERLEQKALSAPSEVNPDFGGTKAQPETT